MSAVKVIWLRERENDVKNVKANNLFRFAWDSPVPLVLTHSFTVRFATDNDAYTMDPPPRSTTQLTGLERPSPLDTPGLLDRILSFLDPYTLASSALLVCRQWSDAGRRYHKPSEYSWPDFFEEIEEFEQVMDMVPWMAQFAVAHKRAEVISHISLSQDGVGHVAERTGGGCREPNTHR